MTELDIGDTYNTVQELYDGQEIEVVMEVQEIIEHEDGTTEVVSEMTDESQETVQDALETLEYPDDTDR